MKPEKPSVTELLATSKPKTPVKITLQGNLQKIQFDGAEQIFKSGDLAILVGDWDRIHYILRDYREHIVDYMVESDRRNSKIDLLDIKLLNARIEPGAIIREHVQIGDHAVIMMGACINIGAMIGADTLIDMNAVIGGGAQIGSRCHIGAGTVIKGVISTGSQIPVVIEDEVKIGPNCVIMEGVRIPKGTVIPAGKVVTD